MQRYSKNKCLKQFVAADLQQKKSPGVCRGIRISLEFTNYLVAIAFLLASSIALFLLRFKSTDIGVAIHSDE
jgi:hypothetical protein